MYAVHSYWQPKIIARSVCGEHTSPILQLEECEAKVAMTGILNTKIPDADGYYKMYEQDISLTVENDHFMLYELPCAPKLLSDDTTSEILYGSSDDPLSIQEKEGPHPEEVVHYRPHSRSASDLRL